MRFLLSLLLVWAGTVRAASIKQDEAVIFFPTIGHQLNRDSWGLQIHGWVFETERRVVTLAIFRKALGIEEDELTAEERAIFAERARSFLVDNERGKRIAIQLCGKERGLGPTRADGHVASQIIIAASEIEHFRQVGGGKARITFRTLTDSPNDRVFSGEVHLLEPSGISVISDIDDTIKVSEVTHRKALLRNTFLKPFQPVEGMADVYRSWATDARAQFHYVTASPWQLYPALTEFIRRNRFSDGTFHMKPFRWKDESFFNLFKSPERYKLRVIEPILKKFPQRRFVLVGDSGERDPEIYAALAQKYPGQVARILIRNVTAEQASSKRYQYVFDGVPPERWCVFRQPGEIEGVLRGLRPD